MIIPYPSTVVMHHPTNNSAVPTDLEIVPAVTIFNCNHRETIPMRISNVTTRTVPITPRALLCELQPVTVTRDVKQVTPEDLQQPYQKTHYHHPICDKVKT